VLEPLQANPTIIEDNCFIGARSEVAEGVIVREGSVLSMGVYITSTTPIVDRRTGATIRRGAALFGVMSGSRPNPHDPTLPSTYCAVIMKTVDERTRSKTSSTSCCASSPSGRIGRGRTVSADRGRWNRGRDSRARRGPGTGLPAPGAVAQAGLGSSGP
jgi:hypothetical protein